MFRVFILMLYICIYSTTAWQIPSNQFLHDFANLQNRKSIIIYLPNIQDQLITGLDKQLIDFRKTASKISLKIACVFHEKITNLTHMSVENDDLHVFIPNDSDMTQSFDVFINLYTLRKKWDQEYWLLDTSGSKFIDDATGYLKNLQLDLDDNLFLYEYNNTLMKEVSIMEYYEIHSSRPRKLRFYGKWNTINGLNVTGEDKWNRRKNLEVSIASIHYIIKVLESKSLIFLNIRE